MTEKPSDSSVQKSSAETKPTDPVEPVEKNTSPDILSGGGQFASVTIKVTGDQPAAIEKRHDTSNLPMTVEAPDAPAAAKAEPAAVSPTPTGSAAPSADAAVPTGIKESSPPAAEKINTEAVSYVKCPNCGHHNRVGELICNYCNTSLLGEAPSMKTKQFDQDARPGTGILSDTTAQTSNQPMSTDTGVPVRPTRPDDTGVIKTIVKSAGSDVFQETMLLRLEVEGYPTPILVYPKAETILGRRDPSTGMMPDVDLTTYAGYRLGVSRKHAVIQLKQKRLEIYDLGSSNGTFVNGARLEPHKPVVLRDGDEITLGKMVMRALFQSTNRT